jgi:hypothetical protein
MSAGAANRIPFVLTSKDPSFAGVLEHLCHESPFQLLTTAGPSITLETVRNNAPVFVLLDLDSLDPAEASRLILKLTLVSGASSILTGATAVPGSPALDPFYQAGAQGSVIKPDGKTSLSLTGEAGKAFLQRLLEITSRLRQRRQA